MKKIVKDGKIVFIRRDMAHISLSDDFNYEDWMDVCTGLEHDINTLKRKPRDYYGCHKWMKIAIRAAIAKLSEERLIRLAYLALRVLVPSPKMFYLNYMMIFGEDYVPKIARVKDFDGLLKIADGDLIKTWYEQINVLILPLLREVFAAIYQMQKYDSMGDRRLPDSLREFIDGLREEAKLLPVYWTDFTGKIVDGEIAAQQICEQGGSFGPVCLSVIEALVHPFHQN